MFRQLLGPRLREDDFIRGFLVQRFILFGTYLAAAFAKLLPLQGGEPAQHARGPWEGDGFASPRIFPIPILSFPLKGKEPANRLLIMEIL